MCKVSIEVHISELVTEIMSESFGIYFSIRHALLKKMEIILIVSP